MFNVCIIDRAAAASRIGVSNKGPTNAPRNNVTNQQVEDLSNQV